MPPLPDHRLVKALDHPVRAGFLRLLAEHGRLTPKEALVLLQPPQHTLSNIVYHVRVLHRLELVEAAGNSSPDGATTFEATSKGESALTALGIPRGG